jgi:hypothetical protein
MGDHWPAFPPSGQRIRADAKRCHSMRARSPRFCAPRSSPTWIGSTITTFSMCTGVWPRATWVWRMKLPDNSCRLQTKSGPWGRLRRTMWSDGNSVSLIRRRRRQSCQSNIPTKRARKRRAPHCSRTHHRRRASSRNLTRSSSIARLPCRSPDAPLCRPDHSARHDQHAAPPLATVSPDRQAFGDRVKSPSPPTSNT